MLKSKNKLLTCHYKRFLSYGSKDVLYVPISNNYDFLYIGQTEELKQCTRKHKLDVIHSNNSNCKKCSENLGTTINIYQFLHEKNKYFRNLNKDAVQ